MYLFRPELDREEVNIHQNFQWNDIMDTTQKEVNSP